MLRTVAVDVHFGIEPTRVVKSTSFDEPEFRHDGYIGDDWRSAFWTEVSVNWLTAVTSIVERFEIVPGSRSLILELQLEPRRQFQSASDGSCNGTPRQWRDRRSRNTELDRRGSHRSFRAFQPPLFGLR